MNKRKKIKKSLKWLSGIVLILIILLASAPYLFKDKIKAMVENSINESINATVSFKDLDLSFFRNFPLASISITNATLINKAPFKGDTLFFSEEVNLNMKITELFKNADETMQLQSFSTANSAVNILINKEGITNYDIALKKETTEELTEKSSFSLGIQEYSINNLNFVYHDATSGIKMNVDSIIHHGKGNFKESILDLDTQTTALISLEMNSTSYMNSLPISLDAILGIDLQSFTFSFKENNGFVNQLPLEFKGAIQILDDSQVYDLSFKTPTSSFKNLLAILPAQYSGNLETIKTQGNFDTKGIVKGILSETTIPTFDISFISKDAMFKYPDLPKSVREINVNATIINSTGNINDTYVSIENFAFRIDKDLFSASGKVSNIATNPTVNISAKGIINLENIAKAYPVSVEQQFSGILKADVNSSFDMNSIEKKQYQKINNAGTVSLSGFKYEGKDVAKPFFIDKTSISFTTNSIQLNEFNAKTGDSDIDIEGKLNNFYGFLFNKEVLKGTFNLKSNKINVNDFMSASEETTDKKTSEEIVKIPAFLECTFIAFADNVIYDNITLSNTRGILIVKDQAITLQNLSMNAFGGLVKLNGKVSTKEKIADFDMNLSMEDVSIKESFTKLNTLKSIAPIADIIGGKMNSTFTISGNLLDDLTPNLKTISGDLLGVLFNTKLKAGNSKVLSYIGNEVSFIDVNKLNLEKIKTQITFKDGNVVVKPFKMKYQDIDIEIGGTHGFDQSMNYNLTFDVPAKYLGNEVTSLISRFSKSDQNKISSVPVKANLTGSFSTPKIKTDLKKATSDFVTKLAKEQKDKILDKGKDKLLNLLGKDKDSSKNKKGNLLKNLFKKKKKDN